MNELEHIIRSVLDNWGYVAILGALLGESAGFPMPGETVLVFASFLAHKGTSLQIQWVILVGIFAAVLGDNIGFLIGRYFGKRFMRWLKNKFHIDEDIEVAQDQIRRHGAATVFWARYIFILRTVTGPVAGALGMEWKEFFVFNLLGGASWVTVVSLTAYAFAYEFQTLMGFIEKISWIIGGTVFAVGYILWRRKKKALREEKKNKA